MHALLQRQLKRAGITDPGIAPTAEQFQQLLERVSRSYAGSDQDRYTLERSLQISSNEMQQLYNDLRERSESRLAEEARKLRAIVDAIGDGLCVVDPNGHIEFANEAAQQMLGLHGDDVLHETILDHLQTHGEEDARLCADTTRWFAELKQHGMIRAEQGHLHRADQQPLAVSFVVNAMLADGELQGAVLVFRDRTETLRQQAELMDAYDRAESASRAKSEFLATMSHEIRTPLNGVLGMMQLLQGTELTSQQRDYADTVVQSGNSLLTILGDILDFSKIEAGKLEFENMPFQVDRAIDEVVVLFSDTAKAKGLALDCHVDTATPHYLIGDPGRLRQVVMNLVANAVKFTSEGSVTINVRPGPRGRGLTVAVTDTGPGIPDDRKHRLFHAFSQTDASTTRRFGGSGLGLAICRRLVEAMNGAIRADSVAGVGSTFSFTVDLPKTCPLDEQIPGMGITAVVLANADIDSGSLLPRLRRMGMQTLLEPDADQAARKLAELPTKNRLLVAPDTVATRAAFDSWQQVPELRDVRALFTGTDLHSDGADDDRMRYLTLPARAGQLSRHLQRLCAPEDGESHPLDAKPTFKQKRVLVAEDNPVNQKVACRMLERLGHEVVCANNGIEALAAIEHGSIDLVLMDCQMPEMDGYEATRRIRRIDGSLADVPIVAMTANAMKGDREHCLAAGMNDYLSKPVRITELDAAITMWTQSDHASE